ncbi:MAG: hypothetical protein P8J33_07875, partial [Pirellulaceae bacterium]|nr:hypothetical protein [Pirellulaceae bacterium]
TNRPPYFGTPPSEPTVMPDVTRFRADLPAGLPEILGKMMASEPDRRFANPSEVAQALRTLGQDNTQAPAETQTTLPPAEASPPAAKLKPFPLWLSLTITVGILLAVGWMIWMLLGNQ